MTEYMMVTKDFPENEIGFDTLPATAPHSAGYKSSDDVPFVRIVKSYPDGLKWMNFSSAAKSQAREVAVPKVKQSSLSPLRDEVFKSTFKITYSDIKWDIDPISEYFAT